MLYPILAQGRDGSLWDDMLSLRRSFDQMFGGYFDDAGPTAGVAGWMPRIDIADNREALRVTADLPGFEREAIDVTVQNGVLTISGERRDTEDSQNDADYRVRERRFGRFERSFSLPSGVDPDQIAAEYTNGVLTISLPKTENAKPRRVKIGQTKGGWRERITAGKSA